MNVTHLGFKEYSCDCCLRFSVISERLYQCLDQGLHGVDDLNLFLWKAILLCVERIWTESQPAAVGGGSPGNKGSDVMQSVSW